MLACLYLKNAVRELQKSDFNMHKILILGKDYQTTEHVLGFELENVKKLSEAERVEVTALREVKSQKSKVKKGYKPLNLFMEK